MALIKFLVLNEEQAAFIRGNEYPNGKYLEPRLIDNKVAMAAAGAPYTSWSGTATFYVITERTALDPDYASVANYLYAIPAYMLDTNTIFLPPPDEE